MTYEQIDEELKDWDGDVYFINILPEFSWSISENRVAGYHEQSTQLNKLIVYETESINLAEKSLIKFLTEEEVTEEDVLVFCINYEYYPKVEGNWIRLKIIKKINKIKNESGRNATNRISSDKKVDDDI